MVHLKKRGGAENLPMKLALGILILIIAILIYNAIVVNKAYKPLENATGQCSSGTFFIFNGTCQDKGSCPAGTKSLGIGSCPPGQECCINNDQQT